MFTEEEKQALLNSAARSGISEATLFPYWALNVDGDQMAWLNFFYDKQDALEYYRNHLRDTPGLLIWDHEKNEIVYGRRLSF